VVGPPDLAKGRKVAAIDCRHDRDNDNRVNGRLARNLRLAAPAVRYRRRLAALQPRSPALPVEHFVEPARFLVDGSSRQEPMNSTKFRIINPITTSIQSTTTTPIGTRFFIQCICAD
jgi:hypothetical protein